MDMLNLCSTAQEFYDTFSPSLEPMHSTTLHRLSTIRLPSHVQNDELANRFRNVKYTVRMSRSGFGLLVGWLTEGVGGEATGAGEGFSGEKGKRGRAAIMRVVNNHLRFDGKYRSSSLYIYICSQAGQYSDILQHNSRLYKYMGRVYGALILPDTSAGGGEGTPY